MKNIQLIFGIAFLFSIVLSSCQPQVDLEKEKEEIMKYLELANKANVENDWETWVSLYAENSVYLEKGEVVQYTKDQIKEYAEEKFTNRNYKYTSIEFLSDPIIHISDDASMAWYIVESKFNYVTTDSLGNEVEESWILSSTFVLEKEDTKWVEVTGYNSHRPKDE